MSVLYDEIGKKYDTTRKADVEITRRLYHHLQIDNSSPVIEIACGTGNYTKALHELGLKISGIDVSHEMITAASKKSSQIEWLIGDVESLPYGNDEYKGAVCVLAIHHFKNLKKSFTRFIES